MSASWGLVKFKKTGNVYLCCYEGTTDILNPFICTPAECYDEEDDCYDVISYCRGLENYRSQKFPIVDDLDEVEIYSDYGGGFYWSGTGSESIKMIKGPLDTWAYSEDENVIDGRPTWVDEWWLNNISPNKPLYWTWRDNK